MSRCLRVVTHVASVAALLLVHCGGRVAQGAAADAGIGADAGE
jgi:hypothetical protein